MKFFTAALVTLLMGLGLMLGLLLFAHGHGAWVLILGVIAFLGLFVGFGCRSH